MTPYEYAIAVRNNLGLNLTHEELMEIGKLFKLAMEQAKELVE